MTTPIYLDYNATTPIDPRVREALLPYIAEHFGNPSSSHAYGARADQAVAAAREQVAVLLGAAPDEIVFTSCGTESNNHAIKGTAFAKRGGGRHIITSQVEHPAVLETCRYLEEHHGFQVTYLPVDDSGHVDPDEVERAIRADTVLVSIMHANNEVGTVQPVAEIAALAKTRGIACHTDAAQSVGKIPTLVDELGVDMLTVAGHKIYAPKGIGCLYVRKGTTLHSFIHGAGHEGGRRAGTENVPYIVALGAACSAAKEELPTEAPRLRSLRDRLYKLLSDGSPGLKLNGHHTECLPNTLNVSFSGVMGQELLGRVPEVAASTGSACHADRMDPSSVLTAMGLDTATAMGAVRLSVGRFTTAEEIERAAELLLDGAKSGSA